MLSSTEQKRLDTLLALAIIFDQFPTSVSIEEDSHFTYGEFQHALGSTDQQKLIELSEWYQNLNSEEQNSWIKRTIHHAHENTREKVAVLDEQIHPSQIVAALNKEPKLIQSIILFCLPKHLAEKTAVEVNISLQDLHKSNLLSNSDTEKAAFNQELLKVIRRAFMSNFVTIDMLHPVTNLDLLSGVEIVRLIHTLGIHEVALACRGINQIELVSSFLKRFSHDDMYTIANHIPSLVSVDLQRLEFAEMIVEKALEQKPDEMLDFIGISLLGIVLNRRNEPERIRFTVQKLPIQIATMLQNQLGQFSCSQEIVQTLVDEAEKIAQTIRGH